MQGGGRCGGEKRANSRARTGYRSREVKKRWKRLSPYLKGTGKSRGWGSKLGDP